MIMMILQRFNATISAIVEVVVIKWGYCKYFDPYLPSNIINKKVNMSVCFSSTFLGPTAKPILIKFDTEIAGISRQAIC